MNIEVVILVKVHLQRGKVLLGLRNWNRFCDSENCEVDSWYGPVIVELVTMHEPEHVPEHLSFSRGPTFIYFNFHISQYTSGPTWFLF